MQCAKHNSLPAFFFVKWLLSFAVFAKAYDLSKISCYLKRFIASDHVPHMPDFKFNLLSVFFKVPTF